MKRIFIGDIAKKFGLNPRTIRYYETIGILPKASRIESGYRVYDDKTIERLEFILKAKSPPLHSLDRFIFCLACFIIVE